MLGLANGLASTSYQWQPNMVGADLKLWLRNGVGITLNGTDVSQWDDSSGNSSHAAQTTAGEQGLASGGGIDFEFDNGDHYDFASDIGIVTDEAFMAFIVIQLETATTEGLFGQSTGVFIEVNTQKKIKVKTGGDQAANTLPTFGGTPFATGEKLVLGIKRDSGSDGTLHTYKNGTLLTPAAAKDSNGRLHIDTLGTKSASNFFDGIMYEVLIYDTTDLTASEITKISNYLNNKHGL